MKKVLFIIFILLCLFLCVFIKQEQNEEIKTIIKDNKNTLVAINYPKTKYKVLNKEIENYVKKIYQLFQVEYEDYKHLNGKAELNIDYEYQKIENKYLIIKLTTQMDAHDEDSPYKEMKTFSYSIPQKKIISLLDIVTNKDKIIKDIKKQAFYKYHVEDDSLFSLDKIKAYPFIIKDDILTLYIKYYQREFTYLVINVPLNIFEKEKTEPKRAVNQTQEKNVINPKEKVIALTFDDGPSKYTKEIISLLESYHINATFFVLGNKVSLYKDTLTKMIQNGNEIGNHSYNHKWMIKLDSKEMKWQIESTNKILQDELGYTPTSIRPTYGSVNQKLKDSTNLNIVLWNVDTLDWKIKDPKKIASRGLKVKDGNIILMHDVHRRTIKALQIMIPKLLEEGYQFVTIDELREVNLIRKKL